MLYPGESNESEKVLSNQHANITLTNKTNKKLDYRQFKS